MLSDARTKKVLQLAKKYFAKNKPTSKNKQDAHHDIDHALRVTYWAEIISEKEKADKTITIPAAILHDIGIPKVGDGRHAQEGAKMCKPILKKSGYSPGEIERISGIIRTHSTDDPLAPKTIEGKVLFDADKLDAAGPVALHRFFFEYQKRGFLHHDAARKTVEHIHKWKRKYGKQIYFTKSARKIGKDRIKYLISKCQEILDDFEKFKEVYEHIE